MTFPKYDEARYQSLIQRASFRGEYWTGNTQDHSFNRFATISTARMKRFGSVQSATNGTIATAAVAPVVDVTGSFSVEIMECPAQIALPSQPIQQSGATGGFYVYNHGIGWLGLYLINAAGALAITLTTPGGSLTWGAVKHYVMTSVGGDASGLGWVNAVPVTVTRTAPAAPAANTAAAAIHLASTVTGRLVLARVYPFALTSEDVSALYAASRSLCSG